MAKVWPKLAVGYGRVSTKKQEEGLDTQVFGITRFCETHGIDLVAPPFDKEGFSEIHGIPKREFDKALEYPTMWCDFGVSGSSLERPMFKALLAYLKDNDHVKDVIFYDPSRLSRNLVDAINFVEEHIRGPLGINVHFVTMPDLDLDDPTQEAMFRMKSMMDDMERKQVIIKVKTAMERLQEQDHEWVGRTPYGLYAGRKDDDGEKGKLHYHQQELEVVLEVLREYDRNPSYSGVATYLNARGYTTRSGGKWYPQQVKRIVTHAVYEDKLEGDAMLKYFPKDMQWSEET